MSTMRDVAARAGVSTKTVSRVFNDDPHVLPATRAEVEKAMRELNYVPNVLATTFRAGRASVIGVAVPDIVDPFFAAIARAIEDTARAQGISTLVTSLGDDPVDERDAIESMLGRKLSGLVVAPVGLDHSWLQRWREHTPIVFVDRGPVDLETDTFTEDDEQGAHLAVSHLIAHGHRRIAYVGDVLHLSTETKRFEGWRRAQDEAGIRRSDDLGEVMVSERDAAAAALVVAVAFTAGGCTLDGLLTSGGPPPRLYVLTPKSTFADDLPHVESQLVVELPIASEGLNTHRIALRDSPLTLDFFANARWTEGAPQMVQTLLVESFENTGKIVSVARQGVDLRADYVLKTELR